MSPSKAHSAFFFVGLTSLSLSCLPLQLQLEIALLEGELQEERNELRRHTLYLQTLQEEGGQEETHRQTDRQKVSSTEHTRSMRSHADSHRQTDGRLAVHRQSAIQYHPKHPVFRRYVCISWFGTRE